MSVLLSVVGHGGCLVTAWYHLSLLLEPVLVLEADEAHATCGSIDAERPDGSLPHDQPVVRFW